MFTAVQLVDEFLPKSQTFIYQYLSKMESIRPVVITQKCSNLDLFPLDHVFRLEQSENVRWIRERLLLRLGIDPYPFKRQYIELVRRHKGQLLHAHFGHVGFRSLALKAHLNLPLITTFYGFDMSLLPERRVWRQAYERLFAEGDLFLVEGQKMAEAIMQLGCPADKVVVQPIAIDLSKIEYRPRQWDDHSPVTILMAGRFVEKKGLIYGLRAFSQIADKWPQVQIRIIGNGPLEDSLKTAVGEMNISHRVKFLGALSYTAYLSEAARAHLFLSPSVTASNGDTEGGAPTTLLEMQAAGIPVVSTRHADIPHVVQDGVSGYLVAERDVDGLAAVLEQLLRTPEQWMNIGQAGKQYIAEKHNIEKEVHKLEDLYRSLVKSDRL